MDLAALSYAAAGAAAAFAAYALLRAEQAASARTAPDPPRADCIVVLGAAVWRGGRPSGVLAGRLERAAELYRAGVAPLVVSTGGVGANPPSEAEVGRRFLVARGVPPGAVILEDRSRSTGEQARLVAALLAEHGLRSAVIVTSAFHARRALRLFRRRGVAVFDGSVDHPGLRRRRRFALREAGALALLEWWRWLVPGALTGLSLYACLR